MNDDVAFAKTARVFAEAAARGASAFRTFHEAIMASLRRAIEAALPPSSTLGELTIEEGWFDDQQPGSGLTAHRVRVSALIDGHKVVGYGDGSIEATEALIKALG